MFDVLSGNADSINRIVEVSRDCCFINAGGKVVDNADDSSVVGKSGFDLTAENRNVVEFLFEVNI